MVAESLDERVGLYSLLRSLHTYPLSDSLLEKLSAISVDVDSPLADQLARLQASLPYTAQSKQNGSTTKTIDVDALNMEMTRLLEGPGVTPAPPYASYYLHGKRLMGPAAIAVRKKYAQWQVAPYDAVRLPDDHLALELGFLAHLAGIAVSDESLKWTALSASLIFLERDLLPWLPQFCTAMSGASQQKYFDVLGHYTLTAVRADRDWLQIFLDDNDIHVSEIPDTDSLI